MRPTSEFRRSFIQVAAAVMLFPSVVAGATFTVNPTQITLTPASRSALLTLRNDSTEGLRFQLSVFLWRQSPTGAIQLEDTKDIVFFPALLALAPGEERRVRVGTTTTAEALEKTYRIFVEELPPLDRSGSAAGVRVLTKMGVPIFVQPAKVAGRASLEDVAMREGALVFGIRNSGNVHFIPDQVSVRGYDAAGGLVFERRLDSWYILAGGVRRMTLTVARPDCVRTARLAIEVQLGGSTLNEQLQTSPGVCGG